MLTPTARGRAPPGNRGLSPAGHERARGRRRWKGLRGRRDRPRQVKGDNVLPGYWRMPRRTRRSSPPTAFFRDGRRGTFSPDGYLSIGRALEGPHHHGGYNVYPNEVELAIGRAAAVAESAVVVFRTRFRRGGDGRPGARPGVPAPTRRGDRLAQVAARELQVPKRVSWWRNCRGTPWARCRRTCFASAIREVERPFPGPLPS